MDYEAEINKIKENLKLQIEYSALNAQLQQNAIDKLKEVVVHILGETITDDIINDFNGKWHEKDNVIILKLDKLRKDYNLGPPE